MANIAEVASNGTIEANLMPRDTVKVVAEVAKAGVELLKDDSLGLYFADLFEDDPLSHLLKDKETLLNDFNDFGVADNMMLGFNDLGEVRRAVEIVDTIEVVKVAEGGEASPVVERSEMATARDWESKPFMHQERDLFELVRSEYVRISRLVGTGFATVQAMKEEATRRMDASLENIVNVVRS